MTVTFTSVPAGVARSNILQNAKLSQALSLRATEISSNTSASESATAIDTSAGLKDKSVSLRLEALSFVFVDTKFDVIDDGATQLSRILGQLQSLATRVTLGGLTKSALEQLSGQFQALRVSIGNVPPSPPGSFYPIGQLLETLPAPVQKELLAQVDDKDAVLGGFSNEKLLGSEKDTSIDTLEDAQKALVTLQNAVQQVEQQRTTIAQLRAALDFAVATSEASLQNQQAVESTLNIDDLTADAGTSLPNLLLTQGQQAVEAQTKRLPPNVLQLLS